MSRTIRMCHGYTGLHRFLSKFAEPYAIADTIKGPLIAIIAEGLRNFTFKEMHPEPNDPAENYTITSFELLRIETGRWRNTWTQLSMNKFFEA